MRLGIHTAKKVLRPAFVAYTVENRLKTKYKATEPIPRRIVIPTLLLAGEMLIQTPKSARMNKERGFEVRE